MKFFIILLISVIGLTYVQTQDIDWSNVKSGIITVGKGEHHPVSTGKDVKTRIVGGKPARPHQFPYQVGMICKMDEGMAWCGGSLISKNYVLTAAHCLDGVSEGVLYLGAHNNRNSLEQGQIRMYVSEKNFIIHQKWNKQVVVNDIALIKLPKPVTLTSNLNVIALPKKDIKTDNRIAIASGWGMLDDSGSTSNILRYVQLKTIPLTTCARYFRYMVRTTNICADASQGKSTCQGDSGGPLVVEEDGVKTIIGLTSFGSILGCESGYPSVYTKIAAYLDWIKENSDVKDQ